MVTATRPDQQFKSSELSRNSKEVFAAAQQHPITVTRRDGDSLVLMSAEANRAREQLFGLALRLLSATRDDHGSLIERLTRQYPWMLALSADDRLSCAEELLDTTQVALSTGEPVRALVAIEAWRSTAEALASGIDHTADWLDHPEPAEHPCDG